MAHDPRGHNVDPYGAPDAQSPWSRHPLASLVIAVAVIVGTVAVYVLAV